MSSSQLPNYLLAQRKRLALSQAEVAYLLGAESGAKVCRYERFAREPGLQTALAYEVIFQKPVSELFAGLYQTMEQDVAERAKILARRTGNEKTSRQTTRKQTILTLIAASSPSKHS